ncbi:MAG: histidinol dehydrogenase [Halothiobacillus sp. 24-54-40]|jgi:histidinol dehydrogenase|nr:histidinol dehydrogenase [Halothiobacillaceae bacterium]OYV47097.1 MAG: histidinol dehydrogenase [Halothiobacillus sp. 20-53-49]OYY34238.1 MAG: histidinol dehydrogenase [Halothiobacillus sp. 35-54-62]OYZ86767.1 MAG: histidinol dehydrogenase [Halothiobacillus sp. 24-54-40]OZA79697.1 MAG: histidinol dehydrogenase [Halothiobacillus sp. 39-53-45]HQS02738.1 histidinol dehydrogenase [Halothiobacillus sp.]
MINRLNTADAGFDAALSQLLDWSNVADAGVQQTVDEVICAIRTRQDAALLEYTAKFDRLTLPSAAALAFTVEEIDAAVARTPAHLLAALHQAAERIRAYAEHQKLASWSYTEADGTVLGQQVTALDRVGLYVPGGKAAYPSSVLMNAIPAKVAGVRELIMVVPTPDGVANDTVLAAARVAGVDRIYRIGGAQAIAALAYGTQTIPAVDKIVGPGNSYVAAAKRAVFGKVGIDMIAGPSEILIVSDGHTNPDWIAMDLFSQAEHDQQAQAILVSPDAAFLDKVAKAIAQLIAEQPRAEIIRTALATRGALIQVADLDEAIALINTIAPEHLELSFDHAADRLADIRHAGAIFVGKYTAEALGDYCAGPNHVLPTSGTARFSSPLGVYDFQKRTSIIHASASGSKTLGELAMVLAEAEGLHAHGQSARYRVEGHR